MITHLIAAGRMETRVAMNLVSNAQLATAADGAVYHAIFHFLESEDGKHWMANGEMHDVTIGAVAVSVRMMDEAGKVNPNIVSEGLIADLLRVIGVATGQSRAQATAITEWIRPADLDMTGSATDAYRSAGLDYGPPGAPFETLDEIGRVLGMTPEIAAKLRPHLSLWTANDPDRKTADPDVSKALEGQPRQSDGAMPLVQRQFFLTIEATASGPSGESFRRRAIVGINPSSLRGFKILAWEAPLAE